MPLNFLKNGWRLGWFNFFLSTGFHGIHVLVGTLILIVSLLRIYFYHFSLIYHINYELSI